MAIAQQMLGTASAVEQAAAHQTTFFIRTVRSIVMLMADAYREFWLPERSGLPVIGLPLPRWHQVQWRSYSLRNSRIFWRIPSLSETS